MTELSTELVTELLELGSATLYEASKRDCILPSRLRPAWPGAATVGRALTVATPAGDNLPLHRALEHAQPGDVLVVEAAAGEFGYWGEVLTVAAMHRGVRALIIDGGVRDVDRLAALGFPVFSSSIALHTTVKESAGQVAEPLTLGSTVISPGDIIVADIDGVIALPAAELDAVLASARQRSQDEQNYLARLRDGELTLDIYNLRVRLDAASS